MRTAHRIPVVGAVNSEQIVRNAAGILWHERPSHKQPSASPLPRDDPLPSPCRHPRRPCARPEQRAIAAIEAHVVGSGAGHLDRLADCLSGERGWYGVVVIEATTEGPTEHIAAKHDLVLAASKSFGRHRKDERLPLISGMDFENAVLFESQSVDWLQCERPGRLPSGLRSGRPRVAAGRAQIHEPPLRIVGAGSPMISE